MSPEGPTEELIQKDDLVFEDLTPEEQVILLGTANRVWEISIALREQKDKAKAIKYETFLRTFKDFFRNLPKSIKLSTELLETSQFNDAAKQIYDNLITMPSSDTELFTAVSEILYKFRIISETDVPNFAFTKRYLELFKALWGDGVPPYLWRMMQRREVLDDVDLLHLWKMSLRTGIDDDEFREDKDVRESVEQDLINELHKNDVFDQVMSKIFKEDYEEIFSGELETDSITKLQEIWQREDGLTIDSWELKHRAYMKLVIIYAISHILGTVNFFRKGQLKDEIKKFVKSYAPEIYRGENSIDQKSLVSTCIKLLRRYLADTTEPDPSKIKDHIRARVDIELPEGVLETGNINEIKRYVTRKLAAVLNIFGTTIDESRLRNSYVKGGINKNSGDVHRALQVTIVSSCDVGKDGFAVACPEAFPFEIQLPALLEQEDREEDDKAYDGRKIREVRSFLGAEIEFFNYVNHLADLFIKDPSIIEERAGGTTELSEKERLGVALMEILATTDEKTKLYLEDKLQLRSKVYKKKFEKALDELNNYWKAKYRKFLLTNIESMEEILSGESGEVTDIVKAFTNAVAGEVRKDDFNLMIVFQNIDRLNNLVDDLSDENPNAALRVNYMLKDMAQYIVMHSCKTNIGLLLHKAKEGLSDLIVD